MEIISHRGAWSAPGDQNTARAFRRSWAAGWGVETDLRDLDGRVVVSHDPPRRGSGLLALDELLAAWSSSGARTRLALNIKADGLAVPVAKALADHGATTSAFVFDMSVPDQLAHARTGVEVYARWSELEAPVLSAGVSGLWLDAFTDDAWWSADAVREHLGAGRRVVVVSPELHGRQPAACWERLRRAELHRAEGVGLCTDLAAEAAEFFA